MRGYQASFASGEISPLLHGRIDLSRYATGLSRLENMIVLPQGGVTRRAGFTKAGNAVTNAGVRLIPFVYNATDSAMLEFGNNHIRVWSKTGTGYDIVSTISSPYSYSDVKDLRYVQSGNVIFLAHRNYQPLKLTRKSINSWILEDLDYHGGPFISGEEWLSGARLKLSGTGTTRTVTSTGGEVFNSGLIGTYLEVEYAVEPKTLEIESELAPDKAQSEIFEVKGTLNVMTSGDWYGKIGVERSADGGVTWVTVRQYVRKDADTQGQWDFTLTETEEGILYRITAQHEYIPQNIRTTSIAETEQYGVSTAGDSASYVRVTDIDDSDGWVYSSDETTRSRESDGVTVTQYRVLRKQANGQYAVEWQTL